MIRRRGRIPDDGIQICLFDNDSGLAELIPLRDEDGQLLDLLIETNEPDVVDLHEVYEHFRRQEMNWEELWRELACGSNPVRDYHRKVALLAPNELDLFESASESVPMSSVPLAAIRGHNGLSGQIKGAFSVLVKLGLLQKPGDGYVRTQCPRAPYA